MWKLSRARWSVPQRNHLRRWSIGFAIALGMATMGSGAAAYAVPAVEVVTNTRDSGPGSLRAALQNANNRPGTTVRFAIARSDRGFARGVWTIRVLSPLPKIEAAGTIVDGSTQTRFGGNLNPTGPEIEISGERAILAPVPLPNAPKPAPPLFPVDGLSVLGNRSVVRGIAIGGFSGNGIVISNLNVLSVRIEGCTIGLNAVGEALHSNMGAGIFITDERANQFSALVGTVTIGGTTAAARNVIAGNRIGVRMMTGRLSFSRNAPFMTVIQGNFIGTNATGERAITRLQSNRSPDPSPGIEIFGRVLIGGATPSARNVITGGDQAILLFGEGIIEGNSIGISASGQRALPCRIGVGAITNSQDGFIGIRGNLVGNCDSVALLVSNFSSETASRFFIENNRIGTNAMGFPMPNNVAISVRGSGTIGAAWRDALPSSKSNRIENCQAGIILEGPPTPNQSTAVCVRGNLVRARLLPIDLRTFDQARDAQTPNDIGDDDIGPNDFQNFPILSQARQGAALLVSGVLNSRPNRSIVIDFYRNDAPASSQAHALSVYLGSYNLTTSSQGNAAFTVALRGRFTGSVTATASDFSGGTSEAAPPIAIVAGQITVPPIITEFSPAKAPVGSIVILSGDNFNLAPPLRPTIIRVGGVSVPFKVLSARSIQLTIAEGARSGPIEIVTDSGAISSLQPFIVAAPDDNDFFINAMPLSGASGSVTDNVDGGTSERREPTHAGVPARYSQWFRWTAPFDGEVIFDTRFANNSYFSPVDTTLAIYTGSQLERLQAVVSNDDFYPNSDFSGVGFTAQSGQSYALAIDTRSLSSGVGDFRLNWNLRPFSALMATSAPAGKALVSQAIAQAASSDVTLWFITRLNPDDAVDAAHWSVERNGETLPIQSLAYQQGKLLISLPEGALQVGDAITIRWNNLRDDRGHLMNGEFGPLVASLSRLAAKTTAAHKS